MKTNIIKRKIKTIEEIRAEKAQMERGLANLKAMNINLDFEEKKEYRASGFRVLGEFFIDSMKLFVVALWIMFAVFFVQALANKVNADFDEELQTINTYKPSMTVVIEETDTHTYEFTHKKEDCEPTLVEVDTEKSQNQVGVVNFEGEVSTDTETFDSLNKNGIETLPDNKVEPLVVEDNIIVSFDKWLEKYETEKMKDIETEIGTRITSLIKDAINKIYNQLENPKKFMKIVLDKVEQKQAEIFWGKTDIEYLAEIEVITGKTEEKLKMYNTLEYIKLYNNQILREKNK